MPRELFQTRIGADDATLDRLARYEALLIKWQRAINLVGPRTLDDIWRRHFLDSAQFWELVPPDAATLMDIGSGGGFPGLVLAALAADSRIGRPGFRVDLVESDQRKATFLGEAARMMGLTGVTIRARRIESLITAEPALLAVDVVTARACAPLGQLLAWTGPILDRGALGLFAKGAQVEDEIAGVTGYQIERIPSASDSAGCLLRVRRRMTADAMSEGKNHDAAA